MIRTPYSTWDPEWSETEHEIFRDFGYAAFSAQMLEEALIHVLLAAEYAGRIKIKKNANIESELFLSKKTLGALITELKKGGIRVNSRNWKRGPTYLEFTRRGSDIGF